MISLLSSFFLRGELSGYFTLLQRGIEGYFYEDISL